MRRLVEWLRQTDEELSRLGRGARVVSTAGGTRDERSQADFDRAVRDALEREIRRVSST